MGEAKNAVQSPYLTSREAAAYLKYETEHGFRTLERLARQGRIRAGKSGKSYLFTIKDLDAFVMLHRPR